MLKDIKHNSDGSTTVTVRRLKRRIRAGDGTFRTLVSLDGEAWVLEASEHKLRRRLTSASNLHGNRWVKGKKKEFDARINPGVQTDSWLNPVPKHGSPMLGKAKGKAQKFRKNLRRKKERNVKVMKAVHFHMCPGEDHPHTKRRFSCSCERPKARHVMCGSSKCLYDYKVKA
jgi:hypothetical protein